MSASRGPQYRKTAHAAVEALRPSVPAPLDIVAMQREALGLLDSEQAQSPVDAGATERER